MILGRKRCWYKQHIWLATWRRRPTQRPDLRCEKCGHKRVSESPLHRLHPCWGRDHPVQPRLSSQTNMHHASFFHLNPYCFSLVSPSLSFFIFSLLQNMSPYHSKSKSSLSFSPNAKSMISGGGSKFLNILFIYILHLVNQQIATLMLLSCKVPCLLRSQQQVLVHSSPGNVCSAGACDHWPVCQGPREAVPLLPVSPLSRGPRHSPGSGQEKIFTGDNGGDYSRGAILTASLTPTRNRTETNLAIVQS